MLLSSNNQSFRGWFKLKEGNEVAGHELSRNRSAYKHGELGLTDRNVLFDLDNPEPVTAALGLNGEYVVDSTFIDPNVNLIGFHLPHSFDMGSQMVLKGIACQTGENVEETVVTQFGKKGLLIREGV